ncbi:MAG: adenylosuccinate synthetase [Candidatus Absconditicoccaceae bacterium]
MTQTLEKDEEIITSEENLNDLNKILEYAKINPIQNLTKENLEDEIFKRGPVVVIFGGQLGDEGKGKVTSQFKDADYVAVGPGGANAGHTVVLKNGKSLALHELPGGAIIEKAKVYIGQGRSVNISGLYTEIKQLEENGYDMKGKVIVAGNAQIIFDNLQKKLDRIIEGLKSKPVGTTAKGMGPTAGLKALRTGPNFNILLNDDSTQLREFMEVNCNLFNGLNFEEIRNEIEEEKTLLNKMIAEGYVSIDTNNMLLNQAAHEGKKILVEASQSAMLAADGGMYPYNTSNDTGVNGIMSALNLPEINTSIAVFKSIKSKVGGGFFPTKFEDIEFAQAYRNKSGEYGATTKRPRDVGYLDAVEGRKVLRTNKTDIIIFTKADMLSELGKTAKVGEEYINKETGKIYRHEVPTTKEEYSQIEVQYGPQFDLSQNVTGLKSAEDLPEEYRKYIDYMLDQLEFKGNVLLGTGPCPDDFVVYK